MLSNKRVIDEHDEHSKDTESANLTTQGNTILLHLLKLTIQFLIIVFSKSPKIGKLEIAQLSSSEEGIFGLITQP